MGRTKVRVRRPRSPLCTRLARGTIRLCPGLSFAGPIIVQGLRVSFRPSSLGPGSPSAGCSCGPAAWFRAAVVCGSGASWGVWLSSPALVRSGPAAPPAESLSARQNNVPQTDHRSILQLAFHWSTGRLVSDNRTSRTSEVRLGETPGTLRSVAAGRNAVINGTRNVRFGGEGASGREISGWHEVCKKRG